MANQLNCLRCGTGMQFIRREKFQLGQTGWVLGDLPNLFAGAMEIEIYVCPKCGKLEFFQPGSDKFAGTADEAKTGSGYLPPDAPGGLPRMQKTGSPPEKPGLPSPGFLRMERKPQRNYRLHLPLV